MLCLVWLCWRWSVVIVCFNVDFVLLIKEKIGLKVVKRVVSCDNGNF